MEHATGLPPAPAEARKATWNVQSRLLPAQVPDQPLSPEEEAARAQEEVEKQLLRRQRLSETMKARWQDPAYRSMMHTSMTSPSTQAKRSASGVARVRKTREDLLAARQVRALEGGAKRHCML